MLKKKVDKAFSILERINQDNEKEQKKQEKEVLHQKKINKTDTIKNTIKDIKLSDNNQLNKNQINDTKLQEIISKPEFYIQLMSFLLFIKQKYPYELKALKYFLTSYEPIEERVMLAYLYFWFGIHMYLISQSIPFIKYK